MDFTLTDEQRMLQDTVSRLVRDEYDFEKRLKRAEAPEGFSREMWQQYAEMGLLGIPFAEEQGGFGGGGVELMLIMQEFGRGLVVEPYLASVVLGGGLIEAAGSEAQREELLPGLIEGESLFAFALGEPESRYNLSEVRTRAERNGEGYRLSGRKAVVLHGDSADRLIVCARTDGEETDHDGLSLLLVDPSSRGVEVRGYPTIDGLHAAEVELQDVEVGAEALLGEAGKAWPAIEEATGRAVVALCAEAVGAMEAACELTLEYLKQRKQFGVPIGKFQALQHQMVDMRVELEQARSITILAASRLETPGVERERTLSAAKWLIGRAGRRIAEQSIQLHGGIGMTWEYALPHYAKRLIMIDHQLGDVDHHLERFAGLMTGVGET